MNICMTHYAFYPTTGGVESHLLDLCIELAKQGHDVKALVGSLAGQPEHETVEGVGVYRNDLMNPEWIRDRKADKGIAADEEDRELINAIKQMYLDFVLAHNIDVIHGHNFHHFVPEHALALTEIHDQGVPNILTVHEVWSEFICEDLLRRARWDTIITFCKHVTEGIRRQAPHLDNVEEIYPGIDVELFSPENTDSKWADKLGLHDRPVIVHPARMLPWKGVIYSVRAMKRIVAEFPDALLIVTDTEDIVDWVRELDGYKEQVRAAVKEFGLEDNIVTQSFPYLELPTVYNSSDVVIYPTIGEEPFGLVPVEAMACGKPVVVTPSGGMVESILPDHTGFFVEKRDPDELARKILLLLRDKDLAKEMGRNGRHRATTTFSGQRMARDTADVYVRAVERHAVGAPA